MGRAPLDKSAKGWVAWPNSDGAHQVVSDYFNIQVRHFRKVRLKSIEAVLSGYNILWILFVVFILEK
jgi:hypothetical protein